MNGEHLKLVSLNIERDKHLDRVFPFIKQEDPDVVCIQELMSGDFEIFEKELQMKGSFTPLTRRAINRDGEESLEFFSIALFTKLPIHGEISSAYYAGNPGVVKDYEGTNAKTKSSTSSRMVVHATVCKGDDKFTVGTTHFTWTGDGKVDGQQRVDLERMFEILDNIPEIVLCGDFNAPRGGEIFNSLSERFTDYIPKHYTTSIDGNLHYAGDLKVMVDGLFSTPHYTARNTKLVCGVSDHCAVVSEILRV